MDRPEPIGKQPQQQQHTPGLVSGFVLRGLTWKREKKRSIRIPRERNIPEEVCGTDDGPFRRVTVCCSPECRQRFVFFRPQLWIDNQHHSGSAPTSKLWKTWNGRVCESGIQRSIAKTAISNSKERGLFLQCLGAKPGAGIQRSSAPWRQFSAAEDNFMASGEP